MFNSTSLSPVAQLAKNCLQCRRPGFNTWVRKDFPGEGNGNPLQYSCLGNPIDRGAWPATVRGVAESDRTDQLTLCFSFNPIHREAMNSCGACALRRAARAVQHCAHLKMFVYVCRCWVCRCEGFPSLGKLVGVCGLLIAVASLVAEHGL